MLRVVVNRSSGCLFSFNFTGKHCSYSGSVDFRLPARLRRQMGLQVVSPFISLVSWLRADCHFPLFCLLACRMARGQEETSTSQAGRKRGPTRGTPSTRIIISSLSMEELRAYCEIPDDIDVKISDGPIENTVDEEYKEVFFT